MNELDALLKQYYSGKCLSPEKELSILVQCEARPHFWRAAKVVAAVAVLALVILSPLFLSQRPDITERILAEIAMNHQKGLPVEAASDRYELIQAQLNRLDFQLLPTRKLSDQKFTLLGGRYCSIQGQLAAQLKIRDERSGGISTLYVTKLRDDLRQREPESIVFDGVRVQLWEENGLLFGLAENVQDD